MVALDVVAKTQGQPRLVLDEGLEDIYGQRHWGDLCGCVCSHMTTHG